MILQHAFKLVIKLVVHWPHQQSSMFQTLMCHLHRLLLRAALYSLDNYLVPVLCSTHIVRNHMRAYMELLVAQTISVAQPASNNITLQL